MKKSSPGRNIVRALVSLFIAGSVVSMFRLQGLMLWLVFMVVYFGVSQLFYNSADKLEQDHSRGDEDPEEKEVQPPIRLWEHQPSAESELETPQILDEALVQSIQSLAPGFASANLEATSQFEPIHADEETLPHFDSSSNRLFITKELFEDWLQRVEKQYHITIPAEKLNEWVLNHSLGQISSWIDEHRPS